MIEYGINRIGENARIFEPVTIGFPSREYLDKSEFRGTVIGKNAVIRSGTILYADVTIGDDFSSGHNVLIREKTSIGDRVSVGSATIIEGTCSIGSRVNIQSMVFIPIGCMIGDDVFIGPHTVLTNDRYPPMGASSLAGPVIGDRASIGANATLLPGVRIGPDAGVAAGAIVTKDVPPGMLAIGAPARHRSLPGNMRRR